MRNRLGYLARSMKLLRLYLVFHSRLANSRRIPPGDLTLIRSVRAAILAKLVFGIALAGLAPFPAMGAFAQSTPSPSVQPNRIVGTVSSVDGNSLTIKSDAGVTTTVNATDSTRVLRAEPGAKSLAEASPIRLADLSVGDRVLVAVTPRTEGSPAVATRIVAMKQGDIAQRQQAEQTEWQRRGVGGLVKSVDRSAATVTIAAGSRIFIIHTTPKTIFRRYDPESIKFADAKPSSLDQIQPGDQLRARGDRSPGSNDVVADEVVAGSFRNIAGTVNFVDAVANTITVTDLATKKPVVIRVTADSQMHKLPEMVAQGLAARLKNPNGGDTGSGNQGSGASAGAAPPPGGSSKQSAGGGQGGQRGDLSQLLQRTPAVQLSDLHKGDAVMIVATQGNSSSATAVTLLAGVELLLTASPAASQSMFSASWNLGGGGAADAAGTP
jgi:hypothetical protein